MTPETISIVEDGLRVEIAEAIFLAMEKQKITRAELACRLGCTRANVTQLLQGESNFEVKTLVNIARALRMSIEIKFVPIR